jgi:hypothetical protein
VSARSISANFTVEAWLSKRSCSTKVRLQTMIRESELEKVLVDGGQSPVASWQLK